MEIRELTDIYYSQVESYCSEKNINNYSEIEYLVSSDMGEGIISRVLLEQGIEVNRWKQNINMNWSYKNDIGMSNIFHISFCCKGLAEVVSQTSGKTIFYKEGDMAFYKIDKESDDFDFIYRDFESLSLYVDLSKIEELVLYREDELENTEDILNSIFKSGHLKVSKAPNYIMELVDEINNIEISNILDYINYKNKILELFLKSLDLGMCENKTRMDSDEIGLIYEIENFIIENLDRNITIGEISSEFNITPYKLQKGFKELKNMTVYEYIRKSRLDISKELLETTNIPIITIANKIGYENPSKFSEAFKNYYNVTPSEYRNDKIAR